MKSCVALRHVAFEDLGAFAEPLKRAGYQVSYRDAGVDSLKDLDPDLLIVLGGPIGVYDEAIYPVLSEEIALLTDRLKARRPTMGICLGAQLIARALGARVYPSGIKEIGVLPISLSAAGQKSCLAPFAEDPLALHWHGDTFDLPAGATLLASTPACAHQAFSLGRSIIAFQFHPEAGARGFERWLIGHGLEIASAGLSVPALRADMARHGAALEAKAARTLALWLDGLVVAEASTLPIAGL
ncbi:glutamine amidotransferase [Rhodospirillum rubrum]|uniref:Glutamine amidotransferase class-I n=1 Tax=Rhodospirillum rubrum (strain ATCC 11170 / ATH 1.1.1 / DSM 467 / LMG 4362 / NCIMB 8255 / S1) TaxID=269796 RepID=Q2RNI9_RHORT|nr:glutamine amidotransferase [Rhodospirillum rubrum]ABC24306.1 Glutamine amidotransferase class-I [Rhodospirillum rubrum ATCC 11170]AEO50057.1 glutamine amidotransferase [Rhodospirillum rubrum F11]MBK5956025.1 GMP synthase [Rhodospirillum rubrum]QXG80233.1 glutamine amidotransferase [Rhodospirillum rubrum]HAP99568.1 glutamine amidotransferase [Rhodospirillum rubrum]